MDKANEEPGDEYKWNKLKDGSKIRPLCVACGDPVKVIIHSGGVPMAAQHCKDCYDELRWGKIPMSNRKRKVL